MLHFLEVRRYELLGVVGNAEKKTEKIRRKKRERKKKEIMTKREHFFSEIESKRLHIWQPVYLCHICDLNPTEHTLLSGETHGTTDLPLQM